MAPVRLSTDFSDWHRWVCCRKLGLAESAEYTENAEIDVEALTRMGQHNSNHGFLNPWIGRPRSLSPALKGQYYLGRLSTNGTNGTNVRVLAEYTEGAENEYGKNGRMALVRLSTDFSDWHRWGFIAAR